MQTNFDNCSEGRRVYLRSNILKWCFGKNKEVDMEVPQYSLKIDLTRVIIPKIVLLVVLSFFFYVALVFNLHLGFKIVVPVIGHLMILAILFIAALLQTLKYQVEYSQYGIYFYLNKLIFKKGLEIQEFSYNQIAAVSLGKTFFDKILHTGYLSINHKTLVGPISNPEKIQAYLNQLINYNKASMGNVQ